MALDIEVITFKAHLTSELLWKKKKNSNSREI